MPPKDDGNQKDRKALLDTMELFGCFCICVLGHLVLVAHKLGFLPANERPIPFHALAEGDSHVPNMAHNEDFHGETVSDTALVLVAVAMFGVQV